MKFFFTQFIKNIFKKDNEVLVINEQESENSLKIQHIKIWLKNHGIENYQINDDLTIDVQESVRVKIQYDHDYPKFNHIKGNFDCSGSTIGHLYFAPDSVDGDFNCSNSRLLSLEGAPSIVKGDFNCDENLLGALTGCPKEVRNFSCQRNILDDLQGGPEIVHDVFDCSQSFLKSLKGSPLSVGKDFICRNNYIENLEGCSQVIGENLIITGNHKLRNLKGFPVKENLFIHYSIDFLDENLIAGYTTPAKGYGGDQKILTSELDINIKRQEYVNSVKNMTVDDLVIPQAKNPDNFLKTKPEIVHWLRENNIHHYKINEDSQYGFNVDVYQRIFLASKKLTHIPVKFRFVKGDLVCAYNQLTTLEFAPYFIDGNLYLEENKLQNLEFCPQIITQSIHLSDNPLSSLEFFPKYVKEYMVFNRTPILNMISAKDDSDFLQMREEHLKYLEKLKFYNDLENQLSLKNNDGIENSLKKKNKL